ncbi:MAG: CapA family protein [Lachnospiraceae bacterium]|nr:CapA family protein [Lachnospiraceae bacterium]
MIRSKRMKDTESIVFTGDIGFDRYMDKKWEDEGLIAGEVLSFLHSGDHVAANVEGPILDVPANTTTEGAVQLMHTMNPGAVKVLKKMHADIWNICNNHIMDAGEEGMKATLAEAANAGVKTLGAGMNIDEASKPLILEEAGGIGLIGVGYQRGCKPAGPDKAGCLNWSDYDLIQTRIDEIKKTCRWCVIVSHGGEEFTSLATPYTRDRYLKYLEMGADVIIGHHPHVPMNYETVGDKLIFYSLGNFIFDTPYQRAQFNTQYGLLVKLNFTKEAVSFDALGIEIDREREHVIKGDIPRIFEDVREEEYKLLAPLSAKAFVAATRRQQIFMKTMKPDSTEEEWAEHFANPKRSGRMPGEGLDFFIVLPLAAEAETGEWKKSSLEGVKEYILEQM